MSDKPFITGRCRHAMTLDEGYAKFLEQELAASAPKRKSDRTRAALKIATAKLLEKVSYKDLRVADIAALAGVGTATFHDYFENRTQVAKEILTSFIEAFPAYARTDHEPTDIFASIYYSNKAIVDIFEGNAGLMRGLFQLADQDAEFAGVWRRFSLDWYKRVTSKMLDRQHVAQEPDMLLLTIYTLGGMVDEFMRGLYLHQDQPILNIIEKHRMNNEALAYFLTLLWYRSIFGKAPDTVSPSIEPSSVKLFEGQF